MVNSGMDMSPVPEANTDTFETNIPVRSDVVIIELLSELVDEVQRMNHTMDGLLYHLCAPDEEEEGDTEH